MQQGFIYQNYFNKLSEQIVDKLGQHSKLYLEVTWNLVDQSAITQLIPQFEADTYKRVFEQFKYDMDIFLCIKAQDVIDNVSMGEDQRPFRDFLQIYLKKIENQFWVKPHIVINLIDIENMYDVIFDFETQFQKLGYRVREKYKIRAYSHDIQQVLSEDGFGNDDHIPTSKKLVLIAGLTPECGKLAVAIAQIYLDQEIDIEAGYGKIDILPNYSQSPNHPLNIMARAQYLDKVYKEEFDSMLDQIDLYQRGLEKHAFIQKVFRILKKPVPEYLSDYVFGQIDDSSMDIKSLSQTAQEYVKKLISTADHKELSEKLEALLGELE